MAKFNYYFPQKLYFPNILLFTPMFNFYSLSNGGCILFKLEEKENGKYYEDESVRKREREKRKK